MYNLRRGEDFVKRLPVSLEDLYVGRLLCVRHCVQRIVMSSTARTLLRRRHAVKRNNCIMNWPLAAVRLFANVCRCLRILMTRAISVCASS